MSTEAAGCVPLLILSHPVGYPIPRHQERQSSKDSERVDTICPVQWFLILVIPVAPWMLLVALSGHAA